MPLSDTSREARLVYFRRLAEMTPAERVGVGAALWQSAYSLQQAALHRQNPGATAPDIAFQIAVSRFGPELARAAWHRR